MVAIAIFLFITVMDVISKEVGRGPPHAMLFADDLVLCESTHEEAEEQLEVWRNASENKGLRVSRKKTEYLPPSSCHDKVKLGGEEIKNVTTFKYLGSMFDAELRWNHHRLQKPSSTSMEQMERSNWSHL